MAMKPHQPRSTTTDACRDLVELFEARVSTDADRLCHTFLCDGESDAATATFAQARKRALAVAAGLQAIAPAGDRALLVYPTGLEYIDAFFGCVHAGIVAVPAYPTDDERLPAAMPRLCSIARDAHPSIGLTTRALLSPLQALASAHPEFAAVHWVATDAIEDAEAADWQTFRPTPDALALLIYTSGSTAAPKGVMLGHGNILANVRMVANAYGYGSDTTLVSWVPHASAWGIVNTLTQPFHSGCHSVFMAPEQFIHRPLRWLRAISRYPQVSAGGPNYAYLSCVERIAAADCAGLDLSGWRTAVIAAEPVRAATLDAFAAAFAPFGFHRTALQPAYGLSEATMAVTDTPMQRGPRILNVSSAALRENRVEALEPDDPCGVPIVGCGLSQPEQRLLIVDVETRSPCPPGRIGELWIEGPNVAQGYWNVTEEIGGTFSGTLRDSSGRFLRTGDLAFLNQDELFLVGRLKDLIIIRGRNHHPQDIEQTVACAVEHLGSGPAVAFSIEAGQEECLVIVHEAAAAKPQEAQMIVDAIRQAILVRHEVLVYAVVVAPSGGIPRTSNGKLQRRACRDAYLDKSLAIIKEDIMDNLAGAGRRCGFAAPRTDTEIRLAEIWSLLLNGEEVGLYDNFLDLGGNSLIANQCVTRIRAAFGINLPIVRLFSDTANVRELSEEIDRLHVAQVGALPSMTRSQA